MRPFTRSLGISIAVGAGLWLIACAPVRVHSFLEPGTNLTTYRSYAWAPEQRFETGDPRLDNNEFFQNRLKGDVERLLDVRGLEKATATTASLLVHYHASVAQRIDVNQLDQKYGYCTDCRPSVYDAGTITIDFVDARTNRLVWRGWSDGSLDGIDYQPLLESRVDDAVTRILRQLPPAL